MSSQGALTSSPSSSSTPQWTYDIFLSFRGEDTRKNFTDHLYEALEKKGILTFRDDEKLKRGNTISKELLTAIEKSRYAIVIFSKNYASSKWCLDELVHIVRCMKETELKVMPVFYHVKSSDVRKQRGTFAQAFKEHKIRFGRSFLERLNKCKSKKMKKWRFALREVANKSGWDLQDRHEAKFIKKIVREMMNKLSSEISSTTNDLLGRESSVQKLISSYFGFENNVGMIGIYGIGGLGKTTLARYVYDNFHSHFEGYSFIANVREGSKNLGLHQLQQQLLRDILEDKNIVIDNVYDGDHMIKRRLCSKKVLLVIDDVDHVQQLNNLAGDLRWFGKGSCIIITTRDERVLSQHGVVEIYRPNELDGKDALKLFCLNAFKNEQPKEGYEKLSDEVVKYAKGLPLAIVTLGSFFVERTIDEWKCAWVGFKKTDRTVFDVLKISYDGLKAQQFKDIFLHIACFFRWKEKDRVIKILTNCGFDASYGISVLIDKSLITVNDNNCLMMHDLLQEMGEQIVHQESGEDLRKQSRLWLSEDLFSVLEDNMATTAIQAIVIRCEKNDLKLFEVLSKNTMSNLKLVIFEIVPGDGDDPCCYQRELFVPNQLRHLSWEYCPSKCLSSSSQPKELVQLDLEWSSIEYLWKGVMNSVNLKFINVRGSNGLIRTPDFSGVPMLERLNLSCCTRLVEIHPSIGKLKRLKYLDMQNCWSLSNLPKMYAEMMQSLEVLDLSYCYKLSSIPEFTGIMRSLSELYLSRTAIEEVKPSSIKCLTALTLLDLSYCTRLECLPSNMDTLKSLETLDLSHCYDLSSIPELTGIMKSPSELNLSRTAIEEVKPSSSKCLTALTFLDLSHCRTLECLPSNMDTLKSLKVLDLSYCCILSSIPEFTGIMESLSKLNLRSTAIEEVKPSSIKCLTALTFLDLSHCTSLECLPSNMDTLKSLETLKFSHCSKLKSLPRFPSNVRCIEAKGFSFLNWLPEGVKLSIWSHLLSQWLPFDESGRLMGFRALLHFLRDNLVGFTIPLHVLWGSLDGFTILLHVLLGLIFRKAVLGGYIIWSYLAEKEGSSVNIKLPSNWYNSEWIGFALWASLQSYKEKVRAHVIAPGDMLWNHRASVHSTTCIHGFCLLYLSREDWIATVGDGECSQIKVEFSTSTCPAVHIPGACGVSLIYKQDEVRVDELNETNPPCFIESIGRVFISKLTVGDEDERIVDDEGVHKFGYDDFDDEDVRTVDDEGVHKFGYDDFEDEDVRKVEDVRTVDDEGVHKFGYDDTDIW